MSGRHHRKTSRNPSCLQRRASWVTRGVTRCLTSMDIWVDPAVPWSLSSTVTLATPTGVHGYWKGKHEQKLKNGNEFQLVSTSIFLIIILLFITVIVVSVKRWKWRSRYCLRLVEVNMFTTPWRHCVLRTTHSFYRFIINSLLNSWSCFRSRQKIW